MAGPNEFTISGTLKDWDFIPSLPSIQVPTLVTRGGFDEVMPRTCEVDVIQLKPKKWCLHCGCIARAE